jgi:hypothetical protein
MSEPDEFDKMGDFSDEQWQEVYELSDIEQAKMRQIDGNKKGDCSGDLKVSMVQRKSLCTLPNTVVASIRVSRSTENTSTIKGKDDVEKRRLERLGKRGHILTTPEQARQDIILLMNQMTYQKDKSFVVEKVVEIDKDKKLEYQAFTVRHMTSRVAKKSRIFDRNTSKSDVRITAVEACNIVKSEKEKIQDCIRETERDVLKVVGSEKDGQVIKSGEEKEVSFIAVTPDKRKVPSKEVLVTLEKIEMTSKKSLLFPVETVPNDEADKDAAISRGSSDHASTLLMSIGSDTKKKPEKNDKSRESLPHNFPKLPSGFKSQKKEKTIKDYIMRLH